MSNAITKISYTLADPRTDPILAEFIKSKLECLVQTVDNIETHVDAMNKNLDAGSKHEYIFHEWRELDRVTIKIFKQLVEEKNIQVFEQPCLSGIVYQIIPENKSKSNNNGNTSHYYLCSLFNYKTFRFCRRV